MKIASPVEGYTATNKVGSLVLDFVDGVADVDQKPTDAELLYLTGAGYIVTAVSHKKAKADPVSDPNTAISVGKTEDAAEGTENENAVLPVVDMLPVVDADALNAQEDSPEPPAEEVPIPRVRKRRR